MKVQKCILECAEIFHGQNQCSGNSSQKLELNQQAIGKNSKKDIPKFLGYLDSKTFHQILSQIVMMSKIQQVIKN